MLSQTRAYVRRHLLALTALFIALGGVAVAGPKLAADGSNTVVRKKTVTLPQTCQSSFGTTFCTGPKTTVTARCRRGEHATGGGYVGVSEGGADINAPRRNATIQGVDRPTPARGTPKGWTVVVQASGSNPGTTTPRPQKFTVYAVCQS